MSSEVSDKTWAVVTRDLGKFYVTEIEKHMVEQALSGNTRFVTLDGNLVVTNEILAIVTGEKIRDAEHSKRGEWKCKYEQWHQKGEQCGHDGKHW